MRLITTTQVPCSPRQSARHWTTRRALQRKRRSIRIILPACHGITPNARFARLSGLLPASICTTSPISGSTFIRICSVTSARRAPIDEEEFCLRVARVVLHGIRNENEREQSLRRVGQCAPSPLFAGEGLGWGAQSSRSFSRPRLALTARGGVGLHLVLVAQPHPVHRIGQAFLVAPKRRQVEIVIGGVHHVEAAGKAGIGVEDISRL